MTIHKTMGLALVGITAVLYLGCGPVGPTLEDPESRVTVAVKDTREMPFHGPGGPGSEPMSITFFWTVVVSASNGRGVAIESIETRIREPREAVPLVASSARTGFLTPGQDLEVVQSAGGFFSSALYPGSWDGAAAVRVRHPNGRREEINLDFRFR